MKPFLLLNLSAFALLSQANAAFVSFDTGGARGHEFLAAPGNRVDATAVTPANVVRFGYLTTANVASSFVEFATTTVNNPLSSQLIGGFINADTTQNASPVAVAALKAAPQVALYVFGEGNTRGLFTSPSWAAPATLTEATDSSYLVLLGSTAAGGAPVVTTIPIPGYLPASYLTPVAITVGATTNATGSRYTLGAVVPEPTTTILLSILGTLGLVRRKR